MATTHDDGLKLMQGDLEVDASLLTALDELGAAPAKDKGDHWVPPTQRRLSSAPPMSLTTDLPIRGVAPDAAAPQAPATRYRVPARPTAAPAPAAAATAVLDEVTPEQLRQEGLEWLRDLARRRA